MKIDRPNIDIQPFAGSSKTEERTAFGSKEITDNLEKNLNADFARGWGIVPVSELPTMQDFNAVGFTISSLVTHLYQNGIAEYAEKQIYNKGAVCLSDGNIYLSKTENNAGNPLTDSTQWQSLKDALLSANIVQQLGNATDKVTSQKLVTDALNGKQPKGDYATKTELTQGLNTKLNKNENGKDIPDKEDFIRNLGLAEGSALPVGVPVPWSREEPPAGWLKCNGARFTATQYPKLAIAYPDLRLPDLRGEFIRGWDDGRGVNPGRQLLSSEVQSVQRHIHNTEIKTNGTSVQKPGNKYNVTLHAGQTGELDNYAWMKTTDILDTASDETRPRNIAFNYIVRAV
ncbi:phage tail protein [Arsenophonus nasoniae]|uniref:phage tail protein n=1 Tax=Arsenophonus nasoniae TaxID=638 RepID=UPI0038799068